ncbi:DUF192 domain-containing protein [Candidatus Saccharibacteria bacterium]|nr:DUF192 domain-containing protein [Candidatus Saccharibacteria bacterium]
MKRLAVVASLVVLGISLYFVWQVQKSDMSTVVVRESGVRLPVRLAITEEEISTGLSETRALSRREGMLFVMPESRQWSFWMKDMTYAIDIVWIDASGGIIAIDESVLPDAPPHVQYQPPQPANYVLEVAAGVSREIGIKPGGSIEIGRVER